MENVTSYIVTAALPYANGPIHIGHLSGVYIPADIYVRYLRINKKKVIFICGSDEHGAPITIRSKKENVSPKKIIDKYHNLNKEYLKKIGINFNIFFRTSSLLHKYIVQKFFIELKKKKKFKIYKNDQFYDVKYKHFLSDRYLIGDCPKCNNKSYGDQCENCGYILNFNELKNPKSILSKSKPILKSTKHWYIELNKHQDWLKNWIFNKKNWKSNIYKQSNSLIDKGLKPRPITRDLEWGINVPLKNLKNKVLYVWFDALIGYISGTKEWINKNEKSNKNLWKSKKTKLINFIGKDNIIFHTIIFPVILKYYDNFILPDNIPTNEFLNIEGKKISTSQNWAIWLNEYIEEFSNQKNNLKDSLRYNLCINAPEKKDCNFTWKDFQKSNNNELVFIFGNFINRIITLIVKYFNKNIPKKKNHEYADIKIIIKMKKKIIQINKSIKNFKFKKGINLLINILKIGNKYLTKTEPWKNKIRMSTILNIGINIIGNIGIISNPFLPFTSKKICSILKLENYYWKDLGKNNLVKIKKIKNLNLLFEKLDNKTIENQEKKLKI